MKVFVFCFNSCTCIPKNIFLCSVIFFFGAQNQIMKSVSFSVALIVFKF